MGDLQDAAVRVKKAKNKLAQIPIDRQAIKDKIANLQSQLDLLDTQEAQWMSEYELAKTDLAGVAEQM